MSDLGEGEQERLYPVIGADTLGARHENIISLSPAITWKVSGTPREIYTVSKSEYTA